MPKFHRYYIPGALVFITCVTNERIPYLKEKEDLDIFWETLRNVQTIHPFHLLAYVILPDHFHWIMQLPEANPNFSQTLHSIKRNFTWNYKKRHLIDSTVHLWQKRFWDHLLRDETDLERHIDYIHWNPVKHNYVPQPEAWVHSTFRYWSERGFYPSGWKFADAQAERNELFSIHPPTCVKIGDCMHLSPYFCERSLYV